MEQQKTNALEMKRINRNTVYKYVYANSPLSKQDIVRATGLSLPTVSQNLKELIEKNLVFEKGQFESTGGRKAQAVYINENAFFSIGLDITKNHTCIVILNACGKLIYNKRYHIPFARNISFFSSIRDYINNAIDYTSVTQERVLGVGIAVPAIVSKDGKSLTYSPILGVEKVKLSDFEEQLLFPCQFCNDANAGGYAENWKSGNNGNIIYLSLNNSVGGAVLINNEIIVGNNQRCGEFGHMTLIPHGKRCYCGQYGCVDAYCTSNILSDSSDGDLDKFFSLLRSGSEEHIKIWDTYSEYLALTVNNLRMNFDYDVILGGYVGSRIEEDEVNSIRKKAAALNPFEKDASYLHACNFRQETTAVGAALHYTESFVQNV